MTKDTSDMITINKSWFKGLIAIADKAEVEPTTLNQTMLLGYISSAKFIIKNMGQIKL